MKPRQPQSAPLLALWLVLSALACGTAVANAQLQPSPAAETAAEDQIIHRSHGFALYGDLKYPEGFSHFDYVNPQAPKGGSLVLMGSGTFDSLNPYILKGTSPYNTPGFFIYGINELNETLLIGTEAHNHSGDEPQSAYGLLAQSLEYPDDLSWVIFNLRPEARFHDGHAVDADDVVFSYHLLLEQGHPRFRQQLSGIASVQKLDELRVRVDFKRPQSGSDLLRFGEIPILPEHYWRERDFSQSTLEPPLLSGPYRIAAVDNGQSITFERVKDYWGKDLAVNRGRHNIERVRFDFYRDLNVAFEAFKAGRVDVFVDYTAKNWAEGYDFPAVRDGRVIRAEIPHKLPGNTQALFFNTRRPQFQDLRVRQALAELFDFEWTNKTLFHGAYRRTESYFPNSEFAAQGLPTDAELALLLPHRDLLPEALFREPFQTSRTQGDGNLRPQLRRALDLLSQAGWELKDGQLTHRERGQPFEFEILMQQRGLERVWQPYLKNLERIGIRGRLRLVDLAQYKTRLDQFDFDAVTFVLPQSLTPGQELIEYFHSDSAVIAGNRNYAGIRHPVVDDLLALLPQARTRAQLRDLVRALDRVLLWQHYMVPNWYLDRFRLAWWSKLRHPPAHPPYRLGLDYWWIELESSKPQG